MGSGSSCCPKCGTTYEGIGGGPKAVAATGKPAAVLPAALESPEAALAALKEMVGSGQCKLAEAPKAKDPYNAAVHELAAASTAAQKAANQLKHHRLLLRQAEEKLANLGRKVADYVAECSVLDEAARKAQVVFDALDSELKSGPAAAQVEPAADVRTLPGFAAGHVSVQDAAAQLAVELLAPQPGERILAVRVESGRHVDDLRPVAFERGDPALAHGLAEDVAAAAAAGVEVCSDSSPCGSFA